MAKKKSKKKHKRSQVAPVASKITKPPVKKASSNRAKEPAKLPLGTKVARANSKKSRLVVLVLAGAIIVLAGVVWLLAGRTDQARNDATNTGQDELLKVQPADGDSLQPNGSDDINPQPVVPNQDGAGSQNLQPSAPTDTPADSVDE